MAKFDVFYSHTAVILTFIYILQLGVNLRLIDGLTTPLISTQIFGFSNITLFCVLASWVLCKQLKPHFKMMEKLREIYYHAQI